MEEFEDNVTEKPKPKLKPKRPKTFKITPPSEPPEIGGLAGSVVFTTGDGSKKDGNGGDFTVKLGEGAGAGRAGQVFIEGSSDMTGGPGSWFRLPQMTTIERDSMTAGWGPSDAGKMWFNTTTNQWEGWTGKAIIIMAGVIK